MSDHFTTLRSKGLRTQNLLRIPKTKKDTFTMKGTSANSRFLITESLHHYHFSKNVKALDLGSSHAKHPYKRNYKPIRKKGHTFWIQQEINPFQTPLHFPLNFLMSISSSEGNVGLINNAKSMRYHWVKICIFVVSWRVYLTMKL